MTRIENIKEYIYDITNGIVKITDEQASTIIYFTENFESGRVDMYRYDSNNSAWIKYRIIKVDEYQIIRKLDEYANSLNYQFYMYECYSSVGAYLGKIFTSNNNVFDLLK